MLLDHGRLLLELVVRAQRLALERVDVVRQEALEAEDGALLAGEAGALVQLPVSVVRGVCHQGQARVRQWW